MGDDTSAHVTVNEGDLEASPPFIEIHTRNALEALPDGTIIGWLQVKDDPTSFATAVLRRDHGPDCHEIFWLSTPHAPAGVDALTFPVGVVWIPGCDGESHEFVGQHVSPADDGYVTRLEALTLAVTHHHGAANPHAVLSTANTFGEYLAGVSPALNDSTML